MSSTPQKRNAFSLLMGNGRVHQKSPSRKRSIQSIVRVATPSSASKFAPCPICDKNILIINMNRHLDVCTKANRTNCVDGTEPVEGMARTSTSSCRVEAIPLEKPMIISSDEQENVDITQNEILQKNQKVNGQEDYIPLNELENEKTCNYHHDKEAPSPTPTARPSLNPTSASISSTQKNAFDELIANSKIKSSSKSSTTNATRFHLADGGRVSWIVKSTNTTIEDDAVATNANSFMTKPEDKNQESWKWSASVNIKLGDTSIAVDSKEEILLSSDIPSLSENGHDQPRRLVQKPSKLSVPVLKSCLQKSIRRKRPLPAVRCAMELYDKSMGDFLRRLPIIILEDSFLHPDFSLIVWLMMAVSKDFIPPPSMVVHIMKIVFEVASCSWKDDLVQPERTIDPSSTTNTTQSKREPISIQFVQGLQEKDEESQLSPDSALILKSFILRKQYGGMKCDIQMLDQYYYTWYHRFQVARTVDKFLVDRFYSFYTAPTIEQEAHRSKELLWSDVPAFLHHDHRLSSIECVPPLITGNKRVIALSMNDVTSAGIDFHCSNVLDNFVSNKEICLRLIGILSSKNGAYYDETFVSAMDSLEDKSYCNMKDILLKLLRKCMWNFSAGVNYRKPLLSEKKVRKHLELFWTDKVESYVQSYAENYVSFRLKKI